VITKAWFILLFFFHLLVDVFEHQCTVLAQHVQWHRTNLQNQVQKVTCSKDAEGLGERMLLAGCRALSSIAEVVRLRPSAKTASVTPY
jgi:hypothetical protein